MVVGLVKQRRLGEPQMLWSQLEILQGITRIGHYGSLGRHLDARRSHFHRPLAGGNRKSGLPFHAESDGDAAGGREELESVVQRGTASGRHCDDEGFRFDW